MHQSTVPSVRPGPGGRLLRARDLEVTAARARLRAARDASPRHWDSQDLRGELLLALERLAATVVRSGAPVPYRLSSEIDLYRRLGRLS
ncbi:hypothetical protein [Nocardioides sp. KR10-350]|uniref:hypothetical protein n=1 Tax=Nocardioides cheoyonin TaxID=3156615 RepID=UPI0032B5ECD1